MKEITPTFAELVQAGRMEQVTVASADGLTQYMAFAPPGAKRADAQWYAFRLTETTAEDGTITTRKACAPGPCAIHDNATLIALDFTQD